MYGVECDYTVSTVFGHLSIQMVSFDVHTHNQLLCGCSLTHQSLPHAKLEDDGIINDDGVLKFSHNVTGLLRQISREIQFLLFSNTCLFSTWPYHTNDEIRVDEF